MKTSNKAFAMLSIAAASALVLSGCASDGGGSAATGEPIKVAAVYDGNFFPEAPPAAQAVFDAYNAAGGFNGRPIQLETYDEKTDPATSATATKDALDSGVVAFVGSSSLLNCAVNNQTWTDNNIVSIQGTGVDPFCFATPNVAAANTGPYFDANATLYNGSEVLGYKAICGLIVPDDAVGKSAYEQAIANWSAKTGKKLAHADFSLVRGQSSYAANVAALKSANCDAVFMTEVGAADAAILAEMTNQGISLPALLLTSAYSDNFVQSVNYSNLISLPAEFAPYSDPSNTASKEWSALMSEKGVPATSFAQGGYLAAQYFIHILESIKGDVTRDSFTEAARTMTEPYSGPGAQMTGTPWIFGAGESHQPNAASWLMQIKPNTQEWVSVGPWLTGDQIGWKNTTIQ
ncbi:MAG: ABC transporter substrate-binding protein [Microbacteriaceae bacterium]